MSVRIALCKVFFSFVDGISFAVRSFRVNCKAANSISCRKLNFSLFFPFVAAAKYLHLHKNMESNEWRSLLFLFQLLFFEFSFFSFSF